MAVNFDGTNDNVATADNAVTGINNTVRTIAVWLKITSFPALNAQEVVYCDGTTAGAGTRSTIAIKDTAGVRTFLYQYQWGGALASWTSVTNPSTATWYHFTVTYDRTNTAQDPVFYVDGVSETPTETVAPSGAQQTGEDSVKCGELSGGTQDWDGQIAELAVWNRALSAADIASLGAGYAPNFFPLGLAAYWPLDGHLLETRSGATFTATNATLVAHPPKIIKFPKLRHDTLIAAAGGGGGQKDYYLGGNAFNRGARGFGWAA